MNFNIYYLNLSKAYEISMMIDNTVTTTIEREKMSNREKNRTFNADLSGTLPGKNKGALKMGLGGKNINSNTLREIIEVKTTKSVYLSKVIEKCNKVDALENLTEGDLIKINKSKLFLHNEEEIRQLKMLNNGVLKGITVEDYDVNNLIDSVLKDYAYLLRGKVQGEEIVLKIPMNVENEFENEYNIDDIFIGDVSVIGIYKGEIQVSAIKNTFNYLTNQTLDSLDAEDEFVVSDQNQVENVTADFIEANQDLHFIDVIAIVQEINFKEELFTEESILKKWIQKLQFWK
ncbi:hypothetical protein P3F89_16170 [Bacillus tropicus]|uniref:Uncharacterized protein n=1 Tax=Bacillus tropicus TaxID=2026188 RepID=A0ABD7ZL08_9BACI|nr:hypothetical protein [Bacillus tropicus]WMY13510.1 hypothetical protein P3F89_16170 [Bacillus tropicus]